MLLNKDGGVENLEIQGTISLEVNSEEATCIRVAVANSAGKEFQFKTHPNIDKQLYASESALGLKDPNRPFPVGAPLGILKWRMQSRDESRVPLLINCWPSASGGESFVNIEYESQAEFDLHNVVIAIPVHSAPSVNQVSHFGRLNYSLLSSCGSRVAHIYLSIILHTHVLPYNFP